MRFTIAQRLALLITGVALLMTYVVSHLFLTRGTEILKSHEIVDLGDETNLRRYEVQEDLRYLGREMRTYANQLIDANRVTDDNPANDWKWKWQSIPELVADTEFLATWNAGFQQLASLNPSNLDPELGYLDGRAFLEAHCIKLDDAGEFTPVLSLRRTGTTVSEAPASKPSPARQSLADLQQIVRREWQENRPSSPRQYQSRVMQAEVGPDERPYYVVAIGYTLPIGKGPPAGLLVLTIDFTHLIQNRFRFFSRHLIFAVNRQGEFLAHPNPHRTGTMVGDDLELDSSTHESRWKFAGFSWQAGADLASEENKTLERSRGARLAEVELDDLTFWFAAKKINGGFARQHWEEMNNLMNLRRQEKDPSFRFDRLNEASTGIRVSSNDSASLQEAKREFDQHERSKGAAALRWEKDLKCSRFASHLVPLHMQLGSHDDSLALIVAGSLEEISNDINLATQSIRWWSLLLCLAAGVVALVPALFLTRPLARINQAAQRLAEGDYSVDLPVRAHGEVGDLARTFHHMAEQIRDRDLHVRDNLTRLDTILKTAAEGIITFNDRGQIEQCNQAAETMFGYGSQELVGAKVQTLMDVPDELARAESGGPLTKSKLLRIEGALRASSDNMRRGRRKDGSSFWLEAAFSDVPLGDRKLITGVFRDVTRRKADEEHIRQLNEQLEERVKLRTGELEEAKGKLEVALNAAHAASLAKDQFVRTVSHELRTPLSSVLGFAELLLNPRATKLRENPQPTILKIHTAGKHLLTLINDLLDVARYTSGQKITLEIAEFDLPPFVQGVVEMTTPLLKKNRNHLMVEPGESLGKMCADETRVRQILLNLLSNACKFTEQGTIIFHIERADSIERANSGAKHEVIFTIVDTGAGMNAEQMADLFKPFYRVDNSTSRRQGGTGLGLSITKMLCEQMGGSVAVRSELGKGSTFTVRLPAQTPIDTPTGNDGFDPRSSGSFKRREPAIALPPLQRDAVLVVDDDAMIRDLMESFLHREGFRVYTAANGEEGIRLARELRPGTVTLDVVMPGMDGWAVLAALKNDARTHDIPVIMVTIAEDRSRGFSLGAADYVTKPIDWTRLNTILRQHCQKVASILVVDDDALLRDQLCQTLSLDGWSVRDAANGCEALKQLEVEKPAVILLDLMMPLMDGFEFLRVLRQRPEFTDVPVVIVTAKELTDDDRQRLNGGVAQILSKGSLSREELLVRLRGQLGSPAAAEIANCALGKE